MTQDTAVSSAPTPVPGITLWHAILAGLCANLVAIGLARFAYTPLLPSLIGAHWFDVSDTVYLGAANLAGYFAGALIGRPLARRYTNRWMLRIMMVAASLAFAACGFPVSVAWFFGWRLLSGISGGIIMVLVAATIFPHVPPHRKSLASGGIFLGLGLGIAASGTLVPLLLHWGLRETWLGLALLSIILTAVSWSGWPAAAPRAPAVNPPPVALHAETNGTLRLLYGQFALMALALVPVMVFIVDYVARGLGAGASLGAGFWILYGVGAIAGPMLYGYLIDRMGSRTALRFVLLAQALATLALAGSGNFVLLAVTTVVLGTFPPGMVPLMLARIHQTLPNDHSRQAAAWGRATIVFALFQASSGYAYSYIFNASGGSHRLLFVIGAAALAAAVVAELVTTARMRSAAMPAAE